jgi:hypothetical protein
VSGAQPEAWDARRDGLALCCVALAAFLIQLMVYDRWIGLLDEGAILQIADQLSHGSVLYRDATHLAWPGVFYLVSWLFDLFGTHILVTRWVVVLGFTLMCGLVYVLARGVAGRGPALVAAALAVSYRAWVLPHWLMISYSSMAFLLLLSATATLAWQLRDRDPRKLGAAGLLVGLAIVFKQDSGGLGFSFLLAFVLLDSARRLSESALAWLRGALPFVIGAAVAPSLTLLAMTVAGAGPDMIHQTVLVPLVYGKLWAGDAGGHYVSFPPLWPPFSRSEVLRGDEFFSYFPSLLLDLHWGTIFRSDLFQKTALADVLLRIVYLLPYALIAGLGARELVRSWRERSGVPPLEVRRLRLLLFFAMGVLLAFNRPRDWIHLMVLYVPTLVLIAPALEGIAGTSAALRRRVAVGVAGVAAGAALAAAFTLVWQARSFYDTPIATERAGVRVQADTAEVLNAMIEDLATAPGEQPAPLGALPYYPMLNFLVERPLATRFITLLPMKKYPDRDQQALDDLDRDPNAEMVYGLQHLTGMPRPQEYAPELFAGLIERYQLGTIFDASQTGPVFGLLEDRIDDSAREVVLRDFAADLDSGRFAAPDYDPVAAKGRAVAPSIETWPFEYPVVSIPATPTPGQSRLSFSLEDLGPARLRFGVAMNPDEWRHFFPTHLRFRVLLGERVLFDQTLEARLDLSDRRWVFADLPLDDYAGRTLHLEIATNNGYGAGLNLGGFARPRLVRDERVGATTE